MPIRRLFEKTIASNTSPITYIVLGGMVTRSVGWAYELQGPVVWAFVLTALAAIAIIIGCLLENKIIVSWGTMVGFMGEVFTLWYNIQVGDPFRIVSLSIMFALVCAYIYWTNSLDRLWSYSPSLESTRHY
jgi:hypothetical protein